MKKAAAAALALMCLTSGSVWAGSAFTGYDRPGVNLVRVTVDANGWRTYEMTGFIVSNGETIYLTGFGYYNPASGRADEEIVQGENRIQTMSTCTLDPWQFGPDTCSNSKINAKGYEAEIAKYITGLKPPISVIPGSDRTPYALALQAAEKAAAIKKAKMQVVGNARNLTVPSPTPTRTPTPSRLKVGSIHPDYLPTAAPTKAVPPTPTPAPLYGAVYTGGNPPATMKVGQVVSVPITVQNTSSQTWPAGGVFHLAFHWFRGGVQIVHDGDRTLMTAAVAPGATINLTAKVTAPPTAGTTTLQWDMVQENVAWFSDKGVPMSTPKSVNVTP